MPRLHVRLVGLVAVLTFPLEGGFLTAQGQPLPARLESYIKTDVKLSSEKQKQLLAEQPVTQILDTDPAKEVAVFGAVWVHSPTARYVAAVKDIEGFEKG